MGGNERAQIFLLNHVKLQHEFWKSKNTLNASRTDFKSFHTKLLPLKINNMLYVATVSCCSVFLRSDYKCVKITFRVLEAELISSYI